LSFTSSISEEDNNNQEMRKNKNETYWCNGDLISSSPMNKNSKNIAQNAPASNKNKTNQHPKTLEQTLTVNESKTNRISEEEDTSSIVKSSNCGKFQRWTEEEKNLILQDILYCKSNGIDINIPERANHLTRNGFKHERSPRSIIDKYRIILNTYSTSSIANQNKTSGLNQNKLQTANSKNETISEQQHHTVVKMAKNEYRRKSSSTTKLISTTFPEVEIKQGTSAQHGKWKIISI
jgi:hypothetical protein